MRPALQQSVQKLVTRDSGAGQTSRSSLSPPQFWQAGVSGATRAESELLSQCVCAASACGAPPPPRGGGSGVIGTGRPGELGQLRVHLRHREARGTHRQRNME